MKGVKSPEYIRKFIPKKGKDGWIVRFYSELMGEGPVGARLSKGSLPKLGLRADSEAECVLLCDEWNEWYKTEWESKKRASTRMSTRRRRG